MDVVDVIQKDLQHKPFNPNSESHLTFLQNFEKNKKKLVVLKSWNQWVEREYVEPDKTHGRGYLDVLKRNLF